MGLKWVSECLIIYLFKLVNFVALRLYFKHPDQALFWVISLLMGYYKNSNFFIKNCIFTKFLYSWQFNPLPHRIRKHLFAQQDSPLDQVFHKLVYMWAPKLLGDANKIQERSRSSKAARSPSRWRMPSFPCPCLPLSGPTPPNQINFKSVLLAHWLRV